MSDMDDYKYQEIKSQGFVFMNIYESTSNYILISTMDYYPVWQGSLYKIFIN